MRIMGLARNAHAIGRLRAARLVQPPRFSSAARGLQNAGLPTHRNSRRSASLRNAWCGRPAWLRRADLRAAALVTAASGDGSMEMLYALSQHASPLNGMTPMYLR
jgi:hypothetical protein